MYLLYGLTATVLFGLAATISLLFLTPPPPPEKGHDAARSGSAHSAEPAAKTAEGGGERLRPLVKTPQSGEDVAQLLQNIRQREVAVKDKEEHQVQKQQQMEMVYQDIKSERSAFDDLRRQISEEKGELMKLLEDFNHAKAVEDQKRANTSRDANQRLKNGLPDMNDPAYIKKQALVMESMSPEGAARFIEQLATTNKLDVAGKILGQMRERQAAKVLESVSDPALAASLTERIRPNKAPAFNTDAVPPPQ
jgi:hypothetical protein